LLILFVLSNLVILFDKLQLFYFYLKIENIPEEIIIRSNFIFRMYFNQDEVGRLAPIVVVMLVAAFDLKRLQTSI